VNKGADSEIENAVSAGEPATKGLRENLGASEAALLAEYTALKNEQTQRIVVRDTVLYVSITANTAIAAIYQQQNRDAQILLASIIHLAWLYPPLARTIDRFDGGFMRALFDGFRVWDRGSSGACRKAHGLRAVIVPARSASTRACG
jgi:hypothetical protein